MGVPRNVPKKEQIIHIALRYFLHSKNKTKYVGMKGSSGRVLTLIKNSAFLQHLQPP